MKGLFGRIGKSDEAPKTPDVEGALRQSQKLVASLEEQARELAKSGDREGAKKVLAKKKLLDKSTAALRQSTPATPAANAPRDAGDHLDNFLQGTPAAVPQTTKEQGSAALKQEIAEIAATNEPEARIPRTKSQEDFEKFVNDAENGKVREVQPQTLSQMGEKKNNLKALLDAGPKNPFAKGSNAKGFY